MHPYVRANNLKDTSQLHSHVRQHQQNVQNILINTERNNRDVPFDNRYAFEHYSDYNLSMIIDSTNGFTNSYQLSIIYRFHIGEPKIGNQGMINTAAATNTHIHYPRDAIAKPQHQQQHYHYHHVNEQMQRKNSYSEASSAFSGSDTMQVRTSKCYYLQE